MGVRVLEKDRDVFFHGGGGGGIKGPLVEKPSPVS